VPAGAICVNSKHDSVTMPVPRVCGEAGRSVRHCQPAGVSGAGAA
jgi:hypothetical protein